MNKKLPPGCVEFDDFLATLPLERQAKIEAGSQAIILAVEASKLKGKEAVSFGEHMKALGAKLSAQSWSQSCRMDSK